MSESGVKLRAVVLSVLMVLSVFAGTAVSAGAAAGNDSVSIHESPGGDDLSGAPVSTGTLAVRVTDGTTTGGTSTVAVSSPNGGSIGVVVNDDGNGPDPVAGDGVYWGGVTVAAGSGNTDDATDTIGLDEGNGATVQADLNGDTNRGSATVYGDYTAPSVSNLNFGESSGDMVVSFSTGEPLGGDTSDLAVTVIGPNSKSYSFDRGSFTESGSGPYTYQLSASASFDDGDGTYSVSVGDAKDQAGNNGGINGQGSGLTADYSYSSGSDTTPPSVTSVSASADGDDRLAVSFDTDEQLGTAAGDLTVTVDGPSTTDAYSFDATDFTSRARQGGGYTYTLSTAQGFTDGTGPYTATVDDAFDDSGNNGGVNGAGSGLSDSYDFATDTTAPTVSSVFLSETQAGNVLFVFSSDELLATNAGAVSVTVDGPSTTDVYTFDRTDFAVSQSQQGYDYQLTTTQSFTDGEGVYTVTVDTAVDGAGNDGGETGAGSDLSDTYGYGSGDVTPPTISGFSASNPSGKTVSVSFFSDEQLSALTVDLGGPESATLTKANFTESSVQGGYTYQASYDASSDGEYTATLSNAEDAAGNDGASGQSDTATVGAGGGENQGPRLPAAPYVSLESSELSTTRFTSVFVLVNATGEVGSADDLALRFYNATASTSTPVATVTGLQTVKGFEMVEVPESALGAESFTGEVELVDTTGSPSVLATDSGTITVYDGTTTSAPETTLDDTASSGIDVTYDLGNLDPANAEIVVSSTTVNAGFQTQTLSVSQDSGTVTANVKASDVSRNFTAQVYVKDTSEGRQVQSSLSQTCVATPTSPCPSVSGTSVTYAANGSTVSGVGVSTEWNWFMDGLDFHLHPTGQPDNREIDGVAGIDSDTDLNVTVEIDNFDPTFVMGTANAEGWSTTTVDSDTTAVTFTLQPADAYWHDQVNNPDPNEWPLKNATATTHYEAIVDLSVVQVPDSFADKIQGGMVVSDAQAFAPPRYNSPKNGNPGNLKITVASPHYETDGSTVNTGFYTAIIPSGMVGDWGVDASQLTANYGGESLATGIDELDSGAIRVDAGIHYSSGTVEISGDSTKPVARTGSDRTVSIGESVGFDGSGSTDDGSVSAYRWDFDGDGSTDATGATPAHSFGSPGSYDVTLTVVDNEGKSSTNTVTVTVTDATAPTASVGSDVTVDAGESVDFDASGSTDNVGVARYAWDFDGDGTADATGVTANHTFSSAGTYGVRVTVTDAAGNSETAMRTVTVEATGDGSDDGGSGDGAAAASVEAEPLTVTRHGDRTDVVVRGHSGRVSADLRSQADRQGADAPVSPSGIAFDTTEPELFTLNVSTPASAAEAGVPEPDATEVGQLVSYVRVDHSVRDDRISDVRLNVTVDWTVLDDGPSGGDMVIYRYHDDEWHPLETEIAGYSSRGVELTGHSPGLSVFAVGTEREPAFELGDATVETTTVTAGDEVTVAATVANNGTAIGETSLTLRADGRALTVETVRLLPGQSTTVEFPATFAEPGEYDLAVDERTVGTVTVESAATATATPAATATPGGTTAGAATGSPPTATPATTGTAVDATPAADSTATPSSGANGPGFGAVAALLAVVLGALVAARRRR